MFVYISINQPINQSIEVLYHIFYCYWGKVYPPICNRKLGWTDKAKETIDLSPVFFQLSTWKIKVGENTSTLRERATLN